MLRQHISHEKVVVCRNLANVRFWGHSRFATSSQSNRVSKRQPMRERVESAGKKTKLDHFKRLKSNRFWNCINMVLTPVREYFFFHVSLPQIASQRYQFKDFGLINLQTKYNQYHLQFIFNISQTYICIL